MVLSRNRGVRIHDRCANEIDDERGRDLRPPLGKLHGPTVADAGPARTEIEIRRRRCRPDERVGRSEPVRRTGVGRARGVGQFHPSRRPAGDAAVEGPTVAESLARRPERTWMIEPFKPFGHGRDFGANTAGCPNRSIRGRSRSSTSSRSSTAEATRRATSRIPACTAIDAKARTSRESTDRDPAPSWSACSIRESTPGHITFDGTGPVLLAGHPSAALRLNYWR